MARRRKKSKLAKQQTANNSSPMLLDKSLPSLPPSAVPQSEFSSDDGKASSEITIETAVNELSPRPRPPNPRSASSRSSRRDRSPAPPSDFRQGTISCFTLAQHVSLTHTENLTLPSTTYKSTNRHSTISHQSDLSGETEDFFIPLALDTSPVPGPPPVIRNKSAEHEAPEKMKPKLTENKVGGRDYFAGSRGPSSHHQGLENRPTSSRSAAPPQEGQLSSSAASSPHTSRHERGQLSSEIRDTSRRRQESSRTGGPTSTSASAMASAAGSRTQPPGLSNGGSVKENTATNGSTRSESFKLQDVPKAKRSGGPGRSPRSEIAPPFSDKSSLERSHSPARVSPVGKNENQQPTEHPPRLDTGEPRSGSPRVSQDSRRHERSQTESGHSSPSMTSSQPLQKPKREDSLNALQSKQSIPRKELAIGSRNQVLDHGTNGAQTSSSAPAASHPAAAALGEIYGKKDAKVDDASTLKHPSEPSSAPPVRSQTLPVSSSILPQDGSFTTPRPAPQTPSERPRTRNNSISVVPTESPRNGERHTSPALPRYSAGGDFSMDEDMARILGSEGHEGHTSVLRRVSKAVKHGRSASDKGMRSPGSYKWPKSPLSGPVPSAYSREISSPSSVASDVKDEVMRLRNELARTQHKLAEAEAETNLLKEHLSSTADIKQVNTELREKRSTMAFLDTQKEIVIQELETMTEHIAKAKETGQGFDARNLQSDILHDFGRALQNLKDSFASEIEELVHRRNQLADEVAALNAAKEKGFQEFEQLTLKNAQLAELNNQLVHNIQELYKANREPIVGPPLDSVRPPPNGLGIYTHHYKERSDVSVEAREQQRPSTAGEGSQASSQPTMQQEQEAEPATVLTAPQVVNIRKGQPKKFNWKKGGHSVAKGVSKGLKGAFSSKDGQITEGVPYGVIPPGSENSSSSLPRSVNDSRQTFGFFGNQKPGTTKAGQWKGVPNGSGSFSSSNAENGAVLFGSELDIRAQHEKRDIPSIITRCIEEVELRGMDAEGIYRKSGGASQVKVVTEGFEKTDDYDISDPDLDIHAVTSALKSYFHKLPTPLITYEVYDKILDSTLIADADKRALALRTAILDLPRRHRDCLEFLVFHLARVTDRVKDNKMSPLNLAVVFAPTIMRPRTIEREMTDIQPKQQAVQFIIENNKMIFAVENEAGEG
ncbi:MAG: hypothetical protein M1819_004675 [Sarea resinae]|nr:MAG: hypothetical protein M1819_004675 [Sarea resinae]